MDVGVSPNYINISYLPQPSTTSGDVARCDLPWFPLGTGSRKLFRIKDRIFRRLGRAGKHSTRELLESDEKTMITPA